MYSFRRAGQFTIIYASQLSQSTLLGTLYNAKTWFADANYVTKNQHNKRNKTNFHEHELRNDASHEKWYTFSKKVSSFCNKY